MEYIFGLGIIAALMIATVVLIVLSIRSPWVDYRARTLLVTWNIFLLAAELILIIVVVAKMRGSA